ncbi:MAG: MBL fold metallo-hydrolase [Coriobacteriales bacterium]|nr:MBL fold metallo-hydrolase [Coriobacteriales bacterium]
MRIHRVRGLLAYSYLVETDHGLYLMDAGFIGHGRQLLGKIRRLGRSPCDLRLAVVTHGHPDHYAGLPELQAESRFDVIVHPAHARAVCLGTGADISPGDPAWARGYARMATLTLSRLKLTPVTHVIDAEDGQRLDRWGLEGIVLFTPGHSDGDLSVVLDSGDAFVGDSVQGRRAPMLPPELPAMFLNRDELLDSWRRLLDSGAKHIWPAHGTAIPAESLRRALERMSR